jgi:hypothetical protein
MVQGPILFIHDLCTAIVSNPCRRAFAWNEKGVTTWKISQDVRYRGRDLNPETPKYYDVLPSNSRRKNSVGYRLNTGYVPFVTKAHRKSSAYEPHIAHHCTILCSTFGWDYWLKRPLDGQYYWFDLILCCVFLPRRLNTIVQHFILLVDHGEKMLMLLVWPMLQPCV